MLENQFILLMTAWAAFALAAITPGPNSAAVIAIALGDGKKNALFVAIGIAIGAFFWAILCGLGLSALFSAFPFLIRFIAIIGGAYLCFLGFKALKTITKNKKHKEISKKHSQHPILLGLTITTTNPKVALFWISLSSLVIGLASQISLILLFAIVVAFIALLIYGTFALVFSSRYLRQWYNHKENYINGFFALYFFCIGIFVIIELGV